MSKSLYLGETLVSIGGEPQDQGWQRPAEWLPLPEVSSSEDKVVALIAVESGSNTNYGAVTFLGGVNVDWGDGSVDEMVSRDLFKENGVGFYADVEIDNLTLEQVELYSATLFFPELQGLSGVYDYTLVLDSVAVDYETLEEGSDYTFSNNTINFNTTVEIGQLVQVFLKYTTTEITFPTSTDVSFSVENDTFSFSYDEIWTSWLNGYGYYPYPELLSLLSSTYTLKITEVTLDSVLLEEGVDYNIVNGEVVFENEVNADSSIAFKVAHYSFQVNSSISSQVEFSTEFTQVGNSINSSSLPFLAIQYDNSDAEIYSVVEDSSFDGYYFGFKEEYWSEDKTIFLICPFIESRASTYYSSLKHEYVFENLDPETEFSENGRTYRQAVVEITPLSGYFIDEIALFSRETIRQPAYTNIISYIPNYLDVVVSLPNAQVVTTRMCLQAVQLSFLNLGKTTVFRTSSGNLADYVTSNFATKLYKLKKMSITSDKFIDFQEFCDDSYSLEELYLNISGAFRLTENIDECTALKKVSGFLNAIFFNYSFEECFALTNASSLTVDLSGTKRVSFLFDECSVSSISLINTSSVENWEYCFYNASALKNLSTIDLSNALSMFYTFYYCGALENILLTNTSGVTTWGNCFFRCASLKGEIELDVAGANDCSSMFYGCWQIEKITLLNSDNVQDFGDAFYECFSLKELSADWSSATNVSNVFINCPNLQKLNITNIGKNFFNVGFLSLIGTSLNREAMVDVFNNLIDISENLQEAEVLYMDITNTLGTPDLTESDFEIATNKGWTVFVD
jgi:hypothetical protein